MAITQCSQKRQLAAPLPDIAEQHNGKTQRAEQQAEAAEQLERGQISILDGHERGHALAGLHDFRTLLGQAYTQQLGRGIRLLRRAFNEVQREALLAREQALEVA